MNKAVVAAAINGVLVGAAMVATRSVVDQAGPITLAMLRYAIGVLILAVPALTIGWPRFARRDLLPMALLGIGQFGILIALLNYGLQFISAARAAMIFSVFPLLTMLLGALLGRERLSLAKSLGVALSIAGVAVAMGEAAFRPAVPGEWLGALAVLASALVGAICSIFYRAYVARYPTAQVSAFAMLASVIALGIAAMAGEKLLDHAPTFTVSGWGAVLFIGCASGLAYYLWLYALARATPTRVTVFMALSPITAAILGAGLLAEPLSLRLGVALLLVVAGLVVAHLPAQANSAAAQEPSSEKPSAS